MSNSPSSKHSAIDPLHSFFIGNKPKNCSRSPPALTVVVVMIINNVIEQIKRTVKKLAIVLFDLLIWRLGYPLCFFACFGSLFAVEAYFLIELSSVICTSLARDTTNEN